MLRGILFDMDGVLVKSEDAWFLSVEAAGTRFRGRAISREEFTPTFGQGTAADLPAFGLNCTVEDLDRFYELEFRRHLDSVWVNPEAAPLLADLVRRGLSLGVVTNTIGALTADILTRAGLKTFFTTFATSDRVARAKPAPDLVRLACSELNLQPTEVWMVGDSRFDRGAAQSAGARFIGLGLDGDARIEALSELAALL